jgi:hypothetical protein
LCGAKAPIGCKKYPAVAGYLMKKRVWLVFIPDNSLLKMKLVLEKLDVQVLKVLLINCGCS